MRETMTAFALVGLLASGICRAQHEVTPELERAVTRGLDYLAATQREDGTWAGRYGQISGVVGLALLSFLAHGEQPGEGAYGQVMDRAIGYIVSTQGTNGLLAGRDRSSPMYSHGFATLALAEVYGMSGDKRIGPALKRAVGLIVSAQNALGGWRYNVGDSSADTTVSGAQMMALRAAANAGIEVPIETIRDGVRFFKDCYCPGGGFGYTSNRGPNPVRSGIGMLVLSLSGQYHSPEVKATADYLLEENCGLDVTDHFYYTCYYVSQAMRQGGGRYWRQCNRIMTAALIQAQDADGSWKARGSEPTLDTAFALLSMEINYDYLPIYQR